MIMTMKAIVKIGAITTEICAIFPSDKDCRDHLTRLELEHSSTKGMEIRTIQFEVIDL